MNTTATHPRDCAPCEQGSPAALHMYMDAKRQSRMASRTALTKGRLHAMWAAQQQKESN